MLGGERASRALLGAPAALANEERGDMRAAALGAQDERVQPRHAMDEAEGLEKLKGAIGGGGLGRRAALAEGGQEIIRLDGAPAGGGIGSLVIGGLAVGPLTKVSAAAIAAALVPVDMKAVMPVGAPS